MRRGDKTPDDLDRPYGNSLVENYEKHDIGHAEIVSRLEAMGCDVENWGIDRRHDDGDDGIIYDEKMDFKVYHDGDLVALVDVKTKGSPDYMGRYNERHQRHYHSHAQDFDVPVFVVMYQVGYQDETVHDGFVFEVGLADDPTERVLSSTETDAVSRFPDGNEAVLVPHQNRRDWEHLVLRIEDQKRKNKER